jgi:hypothetical protein
MQDEEEIKDVEDSSGALQALKSAKKAYMAARKVYKKKGK